MTAVMNARKKPTRDDLGVVIYSMNVVSSLNHEPPRAGTPPLMVPIVGTLVTSPGRPFSSPLDTVNRRAHVRREGPP